MDDGIGNAVPPATERAPGGRGMSEPLDRRCLAVGEPLGLSEVRPFQLDLRRPDDRMRLQPTPRHRHISRQVLPREHVRFVAPSARLGPRPLLFLGLGIHPHLGLCQVQGRHQGEQQRRQSREKSPPVLGPVH
jgi:hypothetical protein